MVVAVSERVVDDPDECTLSPLARPEPLRHVTGIDWSRQYNDVRRLVCSAHVFRRAVQEGADPDDLLQEVLRGILAREAGASGWDRRRAKLGHYVRMVTTSVLAHQRDRDGNWTRHHETGCDEVVAPVLPEELPADFFQAAGAESAMADEDSEDVRVWKSVERCGVQVLGRWRPGGAG